MVNNLALRAVNELEERFPVLDQPADEVTLDLTDKMVVKMEEFRDMAQAGLNNMMGRTSSTMDEVKTALILTVSGVTQLSIGDAIKLGAETVLQQGERLVNYLLPEMREEAAQGGQNRGEPPNDEQTEKKEAENVELGYPSRLKTLVTTALHRSYSRGTEYLDSWWVKMTGVVSQVLELQDTMKKTYLHLRAYIMEILLKKAARQRSPARKLKIVARSDQPSTSRGPEKKEFYLEEEAMQKHGGKLSQMRDKDVQKISDEKEEEDKDEEVEIEEEIQLTTRKMLNHNTTSDSPMQIILTTKLWETKNVVIPSSSSSSSSQKEDYDETI
ncbi:uncharacterized protein [Pleurodeles waltl]